MFKKKIVIELDERYFKQSELMKAVVQALRNKGKECEVIDSSFIIVDGKKYGLTQKNVAVRFGPPVQQAVLVQMK